MSMHRSLKSTDSLARHRNVLTRAERIDVLKDLERWPEDSSPLGFPKVAHRKVSAAKKDKAKQTEETPGEATDKEEADSKPAAK